MFKANATYFYNFLSNLFYIQSHLTLVIANIATIHGMVQQVGRDFASTLAAESQIVVVYLFVAVKKGRKVKDAMCSYLCLWAFLLQ